MKFHLRLAGICSYICTYHTFIESVVQHFIILVFNFVCVLEDFFNLDLPIRVLKKLSYFLSLTSQRVTSIISCHMP